MQDELHGAPEVKNNEHKDEFLSFYAELKDESDRAAVILGAAKIDVQLFHLLRKVLLPTTGKDDELFEGESPLSSFSAKIHLTYRLGLIDAQFVHALNLIRKIRNAFAHESSGCKMESGVQCDRIRELKLIFSKTSVFDMIKGAFFKASPNAPSADFRTALALIEARMQVVLTQATPFPRNPLFQLIHPSWLKTPNDGASS